MSRVRDIRMVNVEKGTEVVEPPRERKWRTFEEAVSAIQRLFAPDAEVLHDEKILDDRGEPRQFDVVLHGLVWGDPTLGVVECRHKGRPVGVEQIDAFVEKTRSVGAHLKIMVAKNGFTRPAISKAAQNKIVLLSLLSQVEGDSGLVVNFDAHMRFWYWAEMRIEPLTRSGIRLDEPLDLETFAYRGKLVKDWCEAQLSSEEIRYSKEVGWHHGVIVFDKQQKFTLNGHIRQVAAVRFSALRAVTLKRRRIGVCGQAIYDWVNREWRLPSGAVLETGVFPADLSEWEDCQSESALSAHIPMLLSITIDRFVSPPSPDRSKIPDLNSL